MHRWNGIVKRTCYEWDPTMQPRTELAEPTPSRMQTNRNGESELCRFVILPILSYQLTNASFLHHYLIILTCSSIASSLTLSLTLRLCQSISFSFHHIHHYYPIGLFVLHSAHQPIYQQPAPCVTFKSRVSFPIIF